ncbi:hypothetical protein M569_09582, partial [Genlisea aurea]
MKIQPLNFDEAPPQPLPRCSCVAAKPIAKSRFKRLLERPFSSVLKAPSPEKHTNNCNRDFADEFEPSTVCLTKMVHNFIEGNNEKQQQKCGINRCSNCFKGNCSESSDDDEDSYKSSVTDACDVLKSLVPCSSVSERNLLADISRLVERNKTCKLKDGICKKNISDGLIALGYNASICKSKCGKPPISPPEHEYIDVMIDGERLIAETDFRSEFEIARSTKAFKQVLQMLPVVFVGKVDRLEKIIDTVSSAIKQTLMKKGMSFPPWRKACYMKAKWLPPFTRLNPSPFPFM